MTDQTNATPITMPDTAPIQLVVLDLGHVLIDVAPSWDAACEVAGVSRISDAIKPEHLAPIKRLIHQSEVGAIDQPFFAARIGALTGRSTEEIRAISAAWLGDPYDGIAELLRELIAAPVAIACLSNTNALHWQQMLDSAHRCFLSVAEFDFQWASHLIGHRKPNAEIYAHAESAASIAPTSILFFDNKPENTAAAAARGWRTHTVLENGDPMPQLRQVLSSYGVL